MSKFRKATKSKAFLRIALAGPSGSGKTYTALRMATAFGGPIAVIDSERGSASLYASEFSFDVLELETHDPRRYIDAIEDAQESGYAVLVIDSLSHAWSGKDGALELVDKAKKRSKSRNSFAAWREVTPLHNALVDAILSAKLHVFATLRTKTEWIIEDDNGKKVPRKIGMAPVFRDGIEYEFTVTADLELDHTFIVSKTRCPLIDGYVSKGPAGEREAEILRGWLQDGEREPTQFEKAARAFQHEFGITADQVLLMVGRCTAEEMREGDYGRLRELFEHLRDGKTTVERILEEAAA